jgi:hypothetical protein
VAWDNVLRRTIHVQLTMWRVCAGTRRFRVFTTHRCRSYPVIPVSGGGWTSVKRTFVTFQQRAIVFHPDVADGCNMRGMKGPLNVSIIEWITTGLYKSFYPPTTLLQRLNRGTPLLMLHLTNPCFAFQSRRFAASSGEQDSVDREGVPARCVKLILVGTGGSDSKRCGFEGGEFMSDPGASSKMRSCTLPSPL